MKTQNQIQELFTRLSLQEDKIKAWDNHVPDYPIIRIPDYTHELKAVKRAVDAFINSGYQRDMARTMQDIRDIVSRMPHVVEVRHHHHFARLTKRVLMVFAVLVGCLALSIWLAVRFYKQIP